MVMDIVGLGYSPSNFIANILHGALYFLPVFLVCNMVGGLWEGLFATLRGHEINEGFLVTGMLFPLTLPPTILSGGSLWESALALLWVRRSSEARVRTFSTLR